MVQLSKVGMVSVLTYISVAYDNYQNEEKACYANAILFMGCSISPLNPKAPKGLYMMKIILIIINRISFAPRLGCEDDLGEKGLPPRTPDGMRQRFH